MATALVGFGSNLGDRAAILAHAADTLAALPGVSECRLSRWRETSPVGGPAGQQPFLNGAARIETSLAPLELLHALQRIEDEAGRRRTIRWDARPLDLDLLLHGASAIETPELTLPHPRMAFRRFVLEPAAEVAGALSHPPTGWSVDELLRRLNDAPRLFALMGPRGSGRTRLARLAAAARPDVVVIPRPACFDFAPSDGSFARERARGLVAAVAETVGRIERATTGRGVALAPFSFVDLLREWDATAEPDGLTAERAEIERAIDAAPTPIVTLALQTAGDPDANDAARSIVTVEAASPAVPKSGSPQRPTPARTGPVLKVEASAGLERALAELSAALDASV